MRIIFMGTPGFAIPSLDILINAGYDIVAVITAPDRYGGRGRKSLLESEIKKYAKKKELNILQPTNLKASAFHTKLKELKADLQVVVAFRMLPESVWNMPPLGTWNLHGSLLPKYRGAAPINWSIIQGDRVTGVTSFKLKHAIDTGDYLMQREIPIYADDTAGDLHDRMQWVAADVVLETVMTIQKGQYQLHPQNDQEVSHAPKLNKENTQIDFDQEVISVVNFVRGLTPYPLSWFLLDGLQTKIHGYHIEQQTHADMPGTLLTDGKSYLKVACKSGYIVIGELQMSGKRKMEIKTFLNGYTIKGDKVG